MAFICAMSLLLLPGISLADETEHARLTKQFQSQTVPFLNTFCRDCHGAEDPEAKLDLSVYYSIEQIAEGHQTWAVVLDRLRAGEMPPRDADPQPSPAERASIIEWLEAVRSHQARQHAGDPGVVLVRRLNNAEYNYTIRDLTGVDIRPTTTFPVDAANEAGFDNSGESLTMSPALLNKYLGAARHVAEYLVLTPEGIAFAPHPVVTDTDRDKYCVNQIVDFYRRYTVNFADYFEAAWFARELESKREDDAAFTTAADKYGIRTKYLRTVHHLLTGSEHNAGPVLILREMWQELFAGNLNQEQVRKQCVAMSEFIQAVRTALMPEVDNVQIDGVHKGSQTLVLWRNHQYAANRQRFDISQLKVPRSDDASVPPFDLSLAESALQVPAEPDSRTRWRSALEVFCRVFPDRFFVSERGRDYVEDSKKQDGEKGRLLSAGFHSMMGYFRDDGPLCELVLEKQEKRQLDVLWQQLDFVTAAPMRQYSGFLWFERTDSPFMRDPQFDFARPENKDALSEEMIKRLEQVYLQKVVKNGADETGRNAVRQYFRNINDQIRAVERARLKAEPRQLNAVIELAGKAWRRPLNADDLADLDSFYRSLRESDGLSHEEAIQDLLVSVLMSPRFSYRVDLAVTGENLTALSDYQLASRLSYFLWSSMPDGPLMSAAEAGTLRQPEVLKHHVARMLGDDRIRGLAVEFGGNWLDFRRFEEHNSVDRKHFPQFTDELRQAMFEEPVRFMTDLFQRDQSVLNLVDADYTFVNRELAKHYGLANAVPTDQQWVRAGPVRAAGRGGLLPMSVFLTKNAPGLRTSPVKRGYWVVRRLLGERIPPPPPNVPELPADESSLGDLTLRQALAVHRQHVSCAGCHERIDSIGLLFEGYGPIGERRQNDLGGRAVDTAAELPGQYAADGVADLQAYLKGPRRNEFVDNFIRKLLSYALGRSLILSDDLLVKELAGRLESEDYRVGVLLEGIVTSPQFLNIRGRDKK